MNKQFVHVSLMLHLHLQELYVQDYSTINWSAQRSNVAKGDIYHPHHWILNVLFGTICVLCILKALCHCIIHS